MREMTFWTSLTELLLLLHGTRPRPDAEHCGAALPAPGDALGIVCGGREARSAAGDRLGDCRPVAGVSADGRRTISANRPRRLSPQLSVPGMRLNNIYRVCPGLPGIEWFGIPSDKLPSQ